MAPTFIHSFDPPGASPAVGTAAELTVAWIEDAGTREVPRTPGATLDSWAVLDSLLQPTSAKRIPFVFREPHGQAQVVGVALSSLFGWFFSRAYLQRCFGLSAVASDQLRSLSRTLELVSVTTGQLGHEPHQRLIRRRASCARSGNHFSFLNRARTARRQLNLGFVGVP